MTLNTIAHTTGAIGVGSLAASQFSATKPLFGVLSFETIVAVLMTLAILFLSEIIPKTIGANNWKGLTPFTIRSLKILLTVLAPLVWVSQFITKRFKSDKESSVLTRTDFLALAEVGRTSGALADSESSIINNLLCMDKLKVQDIMTPRTVMHTVDADTTLQKYYARYQPMRFSRIPIFKDSADDISGMVLKDDILSNIIDGNKDALLSSIRRDVKMISEDKTLSELFDFLTKENTHLAIVHDTYGSITGVVTLEDMMETILGMEIIDESDSVANMQTLARKKWQERAEKLGLI